ncbi:Putative uncharacterized transposon-derived protein F52C9.6, partial [Zootermopsis nevadensis]
IQKLLPSHLPSKTMKIGIYKSIILPVVLYGCEIWPLSLKEGLRLNFFENKVHGVRRQVVHTKFCEQTWAICRIYKTPKNLIMQTSTALKIRNLTMERIMRWARYVARMDGTRDVHRVLVRKPEGKRPLGRSRRRWEDNLRRDLWEIGVEGDWILLAQDRDRWRALVNSVMNLRVP